MDNVDITNVNRILTAMGKESNGTGGVLEEVLKDIHKGTGEHPGSLRPVCKVLFCRLDFRSKSGVIVEVLGDSLNAVNDGSVVLTA